MTDELARSLVERIDALLETAVECGACEKNQKVPLDANWGSADPDNWVRCSWCGGSGYEMSSFVAAPALLAEASQALEEAHERGREAWEEGSSWGQNAIQKERDVLRERAERAEAERDHWKANHDEQVAKKNRLSNKYTLALTNLNAWEQVGWHAGRHFMRYWPGDDGPLRLGWEPVYRRVSVSPGPTEEPCETCHGTGLVDGWPLPGQGDVITTPMTAETVNVPIRVQHRCPDCAAGPTGPKGE